MSNYVFPYLSPHQSRVHEPTAWELELASAIEAAFTNGAYELDALVAALNGSRVRPRDSGQCTAASFTRTMQELGA